MALFDLLGRHWAMGILWNLCEAGPLTFRALEAKCETITPASLNKRLKELRAAELVHRVEGGYGATVLGDRLYDHLLSMADFSLEWADHLSQCD
ncbi:helix-turn-helix domain-containing protein [Pelagibius sp. Alg239-R121]|uniref:winged helix-turn-helix transcriptional regulator n=1 Tax=Pelagibius sp. Alg239-R121 TaxID=2993448 RepID=UPI0024A659E5